jgi:hypothetical protein
MLASPRIAATVRLKRPHAQQERFLRSTAKRRIVRAGRRGGKTTGMAILAVEEFLKGRRILYAVPTSEQIQRFWHEVCLFLAEPIAQGLFKKNETLHTIERPGTEQRIRGKTAWSADTLRGDFADLLVLDEFGLMNEDAWNLVGAPMLLDNNGDAAFIYTPPSFRTAGISKAHDPRHAAKLFQRANTDTTGRWAAFHFTSHENPHISAEALEDIAGDMTALAYKQEILAEDIEDIPGALWTQRVLDEHRTHTVPDFVRIVVGVDPGHDAGIVVVGRGADGYAYVLEDASISGDPDTWARQAIGMYHKYQAHAIVPERNHGGDMVETTLKHTDRNVHIKSVWASHGKYARAEPISALYAQGKIWHVGVMGALESEMCSWVPDAGHPSPNRLDAAVWGLTELMLGRQGGGMLPVRGY